MSKNNSSKLGWQKIILILIVALVIVVVPILLNTDNVSDIIESSQTTAESSVISDIADDSSDISNSSALPESSAEISDVSEKSQYSIADIQNLENTDNFSDSALEHIFDGTINRSGKATGYHYTMIPDSKGKLIDGTRSENDKHGVFTGNVEVDGVTKNNFSSFYPEMWSPQDVVNAINIAYDDALSNPDNPSGSLWIGYYQDIEIDMYLTDDKKIITAYPIFEGA